MYYCEKKCAKEDWKKAHQFKECYFYSIDRSRKPKILENELVRLVLRLVLMTKADPKILTKTFKSPDGTCRSINDLKSHEEDMAKNERWLSGFNAVYKLLEQTGLELDRQKTFTLFCKISINGFAIKESWSVRLGSAVYMEASIYNHSCEPNASFTFLGSRINLHALKTIRDKEDILINYCDVGYPKIERQAILKQLYFFDCKCTRCESDYDKNIDYEFVKKLDLKFNKYLKRNVDLKKAYECSLKLFVLYEQIYGEYHPNLSDLLVKLIKLKLSLLTSPNAPVINSRYQTVESWITLSNIKNAVKITHGQDSRLYKELKTIIGTTSITRKQQRVPVKQYLMSIPSK